ncbi:MAG: HAD family hydrolase [Clostridia bacterium]|nr:HAD family hydrolase [Clostridia bacterium]
MRYRCLILDHDDTVANSTAAIHYPAFLAALDELRPQAERPTLEGYFRLNFDPGFMPYISEVLHFTEAEERREYDIWQTFVKARVPEIYLGMAHLIRRHKAAGGLICVISHSVDVNIRRDYLANGLPEPDLVFGWERPREQRKPSPWGVEETLRRFSLDPGEILVVDDLRPGREMAFAAGVAFAAALWAHQIPEIHEEMRQYLHFTEPEALEAYLFNE